MVEDSGTRAVLSPDNKTIAIARPSGVEWVELETGKRTQICGDGPLAFTFDAAGLWVTDGDRVIGYEAGREAVSVSFHARALRASNRGVIAVGDEAAIRIGWDGEHDETPSGTRACAGRGLYAAVAGDALHLVSQVGDVRASLPIAGRRLIDLWPIFDERLLAMRLTSDTGDEIWVARASGAVAHRIQVGALDDWAVASDTGVAILLARATLRELCLRTGRILREAPSPERSARFVDIDAKAAGLLLCGEPTARPPAIVHVDLDAAMSCTELESEPELQATVAPATSPGARLEVRAVEATPAVIPEMRCDGFAPTVRSELSTRRRREILDVEVRYVCAALGCVIGARWASGTLNRAGADRFPGESRVLGLVGAARPDTAALAGPLADLEHQLEIASDDRRAVRNVIDDVTPLDELAARFDLSATVADLLVAVAAPSINPAARELCDLAGGMSVELLCEIGAVIAPDLDVRALFDPGGAFARTPLVRTTRDSLTAHPAVSSVLARAPEPHESVDIERYWITESTWERLAGYLDHAREPRIALRGRPGRGRRELAKFLAESAGTGMAVVGPDGELADELEATRIRGLVPCVVGAGPEHRELLEASPGPMIACIDDDGVSPLTAGSPVIELGRLDEPARRALWADLLGCDETARALARRFHLPPRLAIELASSTRPEIEAITRSVTERFGELLRGLADRVTDLPKWSEVVLPEELDSSLRELIARHENRDLVARGWGMSRTLRSSTGLVALFSGPPGTGKTLSAGLVARELGRELYRVDVSKVVSKWLGETEKNLGAIFDAAEQADAVLLFDEADSLFARRSAVNSSNDRHANLEVNYLLQRLDTFRGVAILTTNKGSAIDPAFRRRLTSHLTFHLPDAETRERLWEAHLPATDLRADDINIAALAESYPLSGGLIRNIALRAVFLAATDKSPLTQRHLDRAIESEYFERGKLSASGRLE